MKNQRNAAVGATERCAAKTGRQRGYAETLTLDYFGSTMEQWIYNPNLQDTFGLIWIKDCS